jgi:ferritin-like protein
MDQNHDIRECAECGEAYLPDADQDADELSSVAGDADLCPECFGDFCDENGL